MGVDVDDATTTVSIFGEIDLSSVGQIEEEIRSARQRSNAIRHLLIDLRGVVFMDSTGLRLLMSLHSDARQGDYRLTVVRPPTNVHRAIEIAGLESLFSFVGDPSDASID